MSIWLIVVPCRNEAENLADLCASLATQVVPANARLVVVDDGSSDGTGNLARTLPWSIPTIVIDRTNSGGLAGGSAFKAWDAGVKEGLRRWPETQFVVKLDADVRFSKDCFQHLIVASSRLDLFGGLLTDGRNSEQALHIQGALKVYSRAVYVTLMSVPRELGFDVMDELISRASGQRVEVVPLAEYSVNRATGASEGLLKGRKRNGKMCRWTGYNKAYFTLHCLRYFVRRPYGIGTFAILWGYLRGGVGPYTSEWRTLQSSTQSEKLHRLASNPKQFIVDVYPHLMRK